jgi:hypothetical protein
MLETAQIKTMSMAERLQAMEQLWDALCQGGEELPSPSWHEEVLADRKIRAERGEAKFLTLETLRERLRTSAS